MDFEFNSPMTPELSVGTFRRSANPRQALGIVINSYAAIDVAARFAVVGIPTALLLPSQLSTPVRSKLVVVFANDSIPVRPVIGEAVDRLRLLFNAAPAFEEEHRWRRAIAAETARAFNVAEWPANSNP